MPFSGDVFRLVYIIHMRGAETADGAYTLVLHLDGQARIDISGQAPVSEKLSTFFPTQDVEGQD